MTGNIGSKHMLHLPQPTPIQPSSDMTTKTKKQQLTKTHGGQGRTQLQRLRTERRPVTTQERSTLNGPMESAVDQQHKKTLPSKTHNPTHVPTDYTTSGTQRSALSINMSTQLTYQLTTLPLEPNAQHSQSTCLLLPCWNIFTLTYHDFHQPSNSTSHVTTWTGDIASHTNRAETSSWRLSHGHIVWKPQVGA